MGIENGVYTELSFEDALAQIIDSAPSSIKFSPGNPPELILANMFAEADVLIDEEIGAILAAMMSPVGSMIDLLNPNNPRKSAQACTGYIVVTNSTASPISIPSDTICTASTGQQYSVGVSSNIIPALGSADVYITAIEEGIGYNIPAGISFTIGSLSGLTGINTLPLLSGAEEESDAIYLNRIINEKTEYGTQNGSVAVETELKKYYEDTKIYVNRNAVALDTPVPVPGNGYNLVVRTPGGILATAAEMEQIFSILANRLEFINSQSAGSSLHQVNSGTIYTSQIPQSYYYTVAQPVKITLTGVINIRAYSSANREEIIAQANDFAVNYINRIMSLLSGINGTTNVTFEDDEYDDVITEIDISGNSNVKTISPQFGIALIRDLISDLNTMSNTPQVVYDSVESLTMEIDPEVEYESPVTLGLGEYDETFIDFVNDALFSDGSSWYDRYVFLDPANIDLTVKVVEWI
jgi:hypothetical protein